MIYDVRYAKKDFWHRACDLWLMYDTLYGVLYVMWCMTCHPYLGVWYVTSLYTVYDTVDTGFLIYGPWCFMYIHALI